MRWKIISIIFFFVLLFGIYFYFTHSTNKSITLTVSKIVDGDTLDLANGDTVRLLEIDAPEHNQPFFQEAANALKFLEGQQVRLEKDVTNKDTYGRLLRYVYFEDRFVNLEMVKSGLAAAYVFSPDNKYANEFFAAEKFARENSLGIWNHSQYSMCIGLYKFNWNAKGNDAENMNDEYFILKNSCNFTIDLENWQVKDDSYNRFTFPSSQLNSQQTLTVFSGAGKNSQEKLFWNATYPIWNNDKDTLTIRDSDGYLVMFYSYRE